MQQLHQVARATPSLLIEDYFAGKTHAWGMFIDRFGQVRRQFSVEIEGILRDGQLILDEWFSFDDGEISQRVWQITPLGQGRYEGRADDVVGKAEGRVIGNRLRWTYDLKLPIGERVWRVKFDDIMLLQADQVLLNRASMSKFGIKLGEVIIFFRKEPDTEPRNKRDVIEAPAGHRAVGQDKVRVSM